MLASILVDMIPFSGIAIIVYVGFGLALMHSLRATLTPGLYAFSILKLISAAVL